MGKLTFFAYLAVTAGVTYLVRMLPLVLVKKKIRSRFLLSFLYYIPYAVLSVMTIPAIFYATDYRLSAVLGCAVALGLAFLEQSLVKVAAAACAAAFLTEVVVRCLL